MRRFVAWIVDGLPFDPRSRRAIDETLLDWACEVATAPSQSRRWLLDAYGLVAILRTVIVSSVAEVGVVPFGWLSRRLAIFCVVPAVLLSLPLILPLIGTISGVRLASLLALAVPVSLPSVVPLAVLLALMWRPATPRVPAGGVALVVFAGALILNFWMVPLASGTFYSAYDRALSEAFSMPLSRDIPNSQTLLDRLISGSGPDQARQVALAALGGMAGFCALAASSVMLGEALGRRIRRRRLGWIASVPIAYLVAGAAVNLLVYAVIPAVFVALAAVWVKVGVAVLVAGAIERRTNREIREPAA